MSNSFSQRKLLFSSASKSSVFALDFFHTLFGFRHEGDVGGANRSADPDASSRDLFFLAPVFMVFDRTASFSKCSGSSLAFARGFLWRQAVATRVDLWLRARWQCARAAKSWLDLFQLIANAEDEKP
jgi:hypothetical protein